MKENVKINNTNGIDLRLAITKIAITDNTGTHPGDDEIALFVKDIEEYDSDLIQHGDLMLHFSKSQARQLARRLWLLASKLQRAEQRTMADFDGLPVVPEELSKAWRDEK